MGAKMYSLFVKLDNPFEFNIDKIASSLLMGKVVDQEDNSRNRIEDTVIVIYTKYGIEFSNLELAHGVLWFKNKEIIDSFYNFFNKPLTIFVFWNSSFDSSSGFSLIKDGEIIRYRYCFPKDHVNLTEDYGIHGEEESEFYEWLTKEGGFNDDIYDPETDLMKGKVHPTKQTYYYHYTGGLLIDLMMKKYLGFTMWERPPLIRKNIHTIKLSKSIYELFNVYYVYE